MRENHTLIIKLTSARVSILGQISGVVTAADIASHSVGALVTAVAVVQVTFVDVLIKKTIAIHSDNSQTIIILIIASP